MSTIGKISSSLLSIPAELTVAAANLNFDFSLLKVEAPKEFHGVRDALSQFRRDEAESGASHVTARKLGALFESLVPPIPNLLKAYGERVSNISSETRASTSGSPNAGFGLFTSQAGPDATNIWAAATSGRGAMAIQLLACMLARIWKEHEAISLWVELVDRRRLEVNGSVADGSNVAALMAAQQTFSRVQLAAWDSSARSWIKTADAERRFQQTQLMLIIDNIALPVNSSNDLYDSVIKAWTSAMMAMEKLVQGVPQQIRDGATLLAISSWHLYPDMAVLSQVMTTVEQKDPLMNGSLLTFSAHTCPAQEDSNGVFWSLPMAHMRYYSPPVVSRGRLTSDTSRVSMDEFLIVVLGMVLSPWLRTFCADIPRCCRLIRLLWTMTKDIMTLEPNLPNLNWFCLLSGAADRYLRATGIISHQYSKLLALGVRSRSEFVKVDITLPEPAFGLTSFSTLLSLIGTKNEMMENKIGFLRQIAQSLKSDSESLLIKYTRRDRPDSWEDSISAGHRSLLIRRLLEGGTEPWEDKRAHEIDADCQEYASALPSRPSAPKRSADGTARKRYHRWVVGRQEEYAGTSCEGDLCGCMTATGPLCICAASETHCSQACHPKPNDCSRFKEYDEFPTVHEVFGECDLDCVICDNISHKSRIQALGEELRWFGQDDIRHSHDYFQWDTKDGEHLDSTLYTFVLGDVGSCSIYKGENCRVGRKTSSFAAEHRATIDEVEALLESKVVKPELLYVSLQCWFRTSSSAESLNAMVFANNLYQGIPGATVSLDVLQIPLHSVGWSDQAMGFANDHQMLKSPLHSTFSCLAMFESGQLLISPSTLTGVMAMSSHDSIFVASALMSDPSEKNGERPIKRVFGNMGRSEMAFLIPPADPRFKETDPRSWQLINHAPFDGQLLDSFKSTSLHLSLTDFELFLDVGARGLRDRRAVLLESVITVNDKGEDLGDLDILSIFNSEGVVFLDPCTHDSRVEEQHNATMPPYVASDKASESSQGPVADPTNLTSLDCWDELLDPPTYSKSIFRATGNWQARLAATAACKQRGQRVRVLPKKPCVLCIGSLDEFDEFDVVIA